jgi:hypothetical protein
MILVDLSISEFRVNLPLFTKHSVKLAFIVFASGLSRKLEVISFDSPK